MKTLLAILISLLATDLWAFELDEEKVLGKIGFSGCHSSYQKTINVHHRDLAKRIYEINGPRDGIRQYSLAWVQENFIEPEDRKPSTRFKFSNHNQLYRNLHGKLVTAFGQMKSKIDGGYKYYCRTNRDKRCGDGQVYAYVLNLLNYTYNRIYLCPAFWKTNREEQLETMLHELSHLAADTDHYLGTIFTNVGMMNQSIDAYFYQKFMFNEVEWVLKRNSWGFLWMKPRNEYVSF